MKSIFSPALVNLLKFFVVPEALTARPAESSLMGLHKIGDGELGDELEFARCNLVCRQATKVCSCMMGCSKLRRAFGPRMRSPPVKTFLGFIFLRNRNKKNSFYKPGPKTNLTII